MLAYLTALTSACPPKQNFVRFPFLNERSLIFRGVVVVNLTRIFYFGYGWCKPVLLGIRSLVRYASNDDFGLGFGHCTLGFHSSRYNDLISF